MKFILSALLVFATKLGCTAAERILMTRLGPSQSSLFVSNADGSGEQKLTEGYLDYNPVWSPDGQWIVFTSERNGSADLYRMRPDGSGLERLTDSPAYDDQAAFSPDGNQIAGPGWPRRQNVPISFAFGRGRIPPSRRAGGGRVLCNRQARACWKRTLARVVAGRQQGGVRQRDFASAWRAAEVMEQEPRV